MTNSLPTEIVDSTVGVVILAAGASTRMGTPKQLLQFQGRSFLRHTIEAAIASVCQPIVVVLGAYAEKIRYEVDRLPVEVVENQKWQQGMSTSVQVGIAALIAASEKVDAVVLTLCDQPFISGNVINQLVKTYHTYDRGIIASEYAGTLGVPALFDRQFFSELMNLEATAGAKQVFKKYPHEVFPLLFAAGAIDIDTPQDYEALLIVNTDF